jgi:putative glutathione S-transferase
VGRLIDGVWHDHWYDTKSTGGRFVRSTAPFRGQVGGDGPFPAEAGRYHLYVAWACPWAHRTLLYRILKGLQDVVSVSFVGPDMLEHGWPFDEAHPDPLFGAAHLHEIYTRADPRFTGRVTVPVLWDKVGHTIVNNESSEIIRLFDTAFAHLADPDAPLADVELAPAALREAIDAVNADVYDHVNNGVYKAGFATTQEAYDEAVIALFDALDRLETRLDTQPWLCGETLTEADLRLFPTLLRFDPVYHVHFKCSRRRLVDYPNLYDHTRAIFQIPGVAQTVNLAETRRHYFYSHDSLNPHRIVAASPATLHLHTPAQRTDALPPSARA